MSVGDILPAVLGGLFSVALGYTIRNPYFISQAERLGVEVKTYSLIDQPLGAGQHHKWRVKGHYNIGKEGEDKKDIPAKCANTLRLVCMSDTHNRARSHKIPDADVFLHCKLTSPSPLSPSPSPQNSLFTTPFSHSLRWRFYGYLFRS